jgi:phosphoribosyl 1,2-cyclic phosphodiesterase
VEVRCGEQLIILDGGTGLRPLGERLQSEGIKKGLFLFSHAHWDHIQGFPFFRPAFDTDAVFEIAGGEALRESLEEALSRQMTPPNFPIHLRDMGAEFVYHTICNGDRLLRNGLEIRIHELSHPDPSYAYRIQCEGSVLVYATDTEHPPNGVDESLMSFSRHADMLIYDAQFTPDEYEGLSDGRSRRGWGHSTAPEAAKLAAACGVKQLILFHHDPTHDDEVVRRIEREAQKVFPKTKAAYEGLEIHLGGSRG